MLARVLPLLAAASVGAMAQESNAALTNPFTSDADVAAGEKTFLSQCASCHGRDGRGGASGPDLSTGRFKRASSDEGLFNIVNRGIPGTTMPGFLLNAGPAWKVVAYVRSLSLGRRDQGSTGDAARGAVLFAAQKCGGCHGNAAPDLAAIAGNRAAAELRLSILDPQADVPSAYWRVTVTTKGGESVTGTRLNEDTFTMQMRDRAGKLRSFLKTDLTRAELDRSSPMPSYRDKLSATEIDDLAAYLYSRSAR